MKLVLASFWLFSAVTISTYQANLAAFLTSSKLNTELTSIKSLADQFTIRYSALGYLLNFLFESYRVKNVKKNLNNIEGSETKDYFEGLKTLEQKFFQVKINQVLKPFFLN